MINQKKSKMRNKQVIKLQININKLGGDPVELNSIKRQQPETEFPKEAIKNPEDLTFDPSTKKLILEGFTQNAAKNILTISKDALRLYRVNKDSIDFQSCFKIPRNDFFLITESSTHNVDKKSCSVQLFPLEGYRRSVVLEFDYKNGKFIEYGQKGPKDNFNDIFCMLFYI